jgi:Glycosyltransferase family 29 (sialyltransferase)
LRRTMNADEIKYHLSQIETDDEYANLLAGKRVVVVGPAETLVGGGQGERIDSYDLIVRFNTAIGYMPFSPELAADIGARTDILYLNNEIINDYIIGEQGISHEKFADACKSAAIKYFVGTNNDFDGYEPDDHDPDYYSEHQIFKRFLARKRIGARFRALFSTSAAVRKILNGHVGRTGFIAIVDLLCYDISELAVTGMTFYHKGGHLFFNDHVPELHPLKDHLGRNTKVNNSPGHNSYLELDAMKMLAACFGEKLKVDERLQELFEARVSD